MEQLLPRESGAYLKMVLGSVNVSILDRKARYDYKDQYEQFKLIVNIIGKKIEIQNDDHVLISPFLFFQALSWLVAMFTSQIESWI